MKPLLLIAALSNPVMAAQTIKHFGDWEVSSEGYILTATSTPVKASNRALVFRCNIEHKNCVFTYTEAKPCNSQKFRFLHLSALADNVAANLKSQCIGGQWVKAPFVWDDMDPILYHSQKDFSIRFSDEVDTATIYSKKGAEDALKYILGIDNNFNHRNQKMALKDPEP
ncbi:hypothetical protein [Parashewanella curva]|nr:hypothetical protein [Parashewanella curva]